MSDLKIININIHNKQLKQLTKKIIEEHKTNKEKKRVVTENWSFNQEEYQYENQMKTIKNICNNNYNYSDDISKIMLQQISKKIYGYKQQDTIKKIFNASNFINLTSIINKMIEYELKCYYCCKEMLVLYDISREMKQWSVDRIYNDKGHNLDNYYLACLECNLKRRRINDEKFLFTKQLKLVKKDDS
jgi:hypothetical protein